MIVVFGVRTKGGADWEGILRCPACSKWCAHQGVHTQRSFTLFFVPVLPVSTTRLRVCAVCRRKEKLDEAAYESTARRAREGQRLVEAYKRSPAELERRLAMSEIHVRSFAG
nr:hypothetical protein [Dehalococcoidia bacterium]